MFVSLMITLAIFVIGAIALLVIYLKSKKTPKPQTESFFPVEEIINGSLKIGSSFIRILSVQPVNYYLLNPSDQQAFEEALMDAVRSLNIPFQVFSTVRSVDVRIPSLQLKEIAVQETPVRARYAKDLANYLEATVSEKAFQKRDTFVVVWADTLQDVDSHMYQAMEAFSRARVTLIPLGSAEVVDLLYELFNRDAIFKPSLSVERGALEKFVKGRGIVIQAKEHLEETA